MGFDLGGLTSTAFNAALAWYLNKKDEQKPNFYPVPLTPEDQYWHDKKKELYERGGSDQMKGLTQMAGQYLGQIPGGPSNHSFMSPHMKGQSFAGGVKYPTFDMSKVPGFGGPSGTPPPSGNGAGVTSPPDLERFPDNAAKPDPEFTVGSPHEVNHPSPGISKGSPEDSRLTEAWNTFKLNHPNWAKLGVNAVLSALTAGTGIAGAVVSHWLKGHLLSQPTSGHTNVDFSNSTLGGTPRTDSGFIGGSITGPRPGTPSGTVPSRGKTIFGGAGEAWFPSGAVTDAITPKPPPAFAEERGAYWADQWERNLRNPQGGGGGGVGVTTDVGSFNQYLK